MKNYKVHVFAAVLCGMFLTFGGPIEAHHSVAAEFDAANLVTVTGTLTRIDWILPHAWLYVDVKAADGTIQHWGFQTPTAFRRQGASARGYFEVGQTLTVTSAVARSGDLKGYIAFITLPDGRKLSMAGQL
jgi:hypothetical protein